MLGFSRDEAMCPFIYERLFNNRFAIDKISQKQIRKP
jgi:hypothetical protein